MRQDVKTQTGRTNADTKTVLFLGFGYVARAMALALKDSPMNCAGTIRQLEKAQQLQSLGVTPLLYPDAFKTLDGTITHIVVSIPPRNLSDPVLGQFPNIKDFFPNIEWVGYLSATSVYGNRHGHWAFEDEYLHPTTPRGRGRVEAELAWLETGLPVHIFRLAGIYGPEILGLSRNPFTRIKSGTARAIEKTGHVVNRIHVDDIVSALRASINSPNPMQIYNIADGHPAPPQDVLDYAANLMGANPVRRVDVSDPDVSDMARSFYSETKRISIERAQNELNWTPQFNNYETGLNDIAQRDGWLKTQ